MPNETAGAAAKLPFASTPIGFAITTLAEVLPFLLGLRRGRGPEYFKYSDYLRDLEKKSFIDEDLSSRILAKVFRWPEFQDLLALGPTAAFDFFLLGEEPIGSGIPLNYRQFDELARVLRS
jgi:hypothetical protein